MGLPLLLGIFIYIIVIFILAIWLKNYHNRMRLSGASMQNTEENMIPEKLIEETIDQKDGISENDSQTTLESGDRS